MWYSHHSFLKKSVKTVSLYAYSTAFFEKLNVCMNVCSELSIRHTLSLFSYDGCVVSRQTCCSSSCLQMARQRSRQDRPVWLLLVLISSLLWCPGVPWNRTCPLNTLTQTAQRLYLIRTRPLTRTQVCRSLGQRPGLSVQCVQLGRSSYYKWIISSALYLFLKPHVYCRLAVEMALMHTTPCWSDFPLSLSWGPIEML